MTEQLRRPPRRHADGYNMVALVIAVTLLNVLVAAALPVWSHLMQRHKEEELIFRGLQYAEAIRVFRQRFGRYPVRLEELIEVEPRSIRRLWKDPMTEDGEWGLIFATARQPRQRRGGRAQRPGQVQVPEPPRRGAIGRGMGQRGRQVTVGPIRGVFSKSSETSILVFNDQNAYSQWQFTEDLVAAVAQPADPSQPPRIPSARWIGRPFRPGIGPQQGRGPGGTPPDQRPGRRPPGTGSPGRSGGSG
jgi:type II secretory pathway pseudopilin PulG